MPSKKKTATKNNGVISKDQITPTSSLFDIKDKYFASLDIYRKKIRSCEKKIRELEALVNQTREKVAQPLQADREERLKIKKLELDTWCEAVQIVEQVRHDEKNNSTEKLEISEVIEGLELLNNVVEKEEYFASYKPTSKKQLQSEEAEKVLALGKHLSFKCGNKGFIDRFASLHSLIKYIRGEVVYENDQYIRFCDFLKLTEKVKKAIAHETSLQKNTHVEDDRKSVVDQENSANDDVNHVPINGKKNQSHMHTEKVAAEPKIETVVSITENEIAVCEEISHHESEHRQHKVSESHSIHGSRNNKAPHKAGRKAKPEKVRIIVTDTTKSRQVVSSAHSETTRDASHVETLSKTDSVSTKADKSEDAFVVQADAEKTGFVEDMTVSAITNAIENYQIDSDEEGWEGPSAANVNKGRNNRGDANKRRNFQDGNGQNKGRWNKDRPFKNTEQRTESFRSNNKNGEFNGYNRKNQENSRQNFKNGDKFRSSNSKENGQDGYSKNRYQRDRQVQHAVQN